MIPSRPPSSALPSIVALTIVYIVWGSTYLAIAYVVETLPPFLAAGARFLAAGGLLLAFLLAQDRWRRSRGAESRLERPRLVEWRTALIVGALLLLGGNGMVMVAEQTIPSGIAAVVIATVPIWMSVFDALLTRRPPSLLAIGGLVVGLLGVGILLLPTTGLDALDPVGIGLLVLATVSWAAGSLYARHGPLPRNQLLGTGMEQLAGGATLAVLGLAVGEGARLDVGSVSTESWIALAYLIVFGSLVAFTAYVWLLNHVAVTTVATYAYVNPIVAVALGVLFRSEPLTPRTLLAAALIIGAVVAMVSGRPREAEEPGPSPETAPLEPAAEERS
ncbi:MAG TPA: EamA family transporter [candidate division Zixibacteria bacterium]|nr:EamA family transporter [candidate division Zixibacteria bacterium]